MKAWYTSYDAANIGQKDFTIVIQDTCENPTLTPPVFSDEIYLIGSGAQVAGLTTFSFNVSPTYCPVTYSLGVSPTIADVGAIVLDSSDITASDITFSSSNNALEATYTVTITCLTPLGADVGSSFSFDVEFQDPCRLATLTIDQTTLTAVSYTYVIDAAADVQTFLDTKVSSTDSSGICPTDYVFTITKRDGTAFDTSLFTWDAAAQSFSTSTSDFNYYTNTPNELTAHVAYSGGYAVAGTLDFEVVVDISCTSAVFDAYSVADMLFTIKGTPDT